MSPVTHTSPRPDFFWDYDISEEQVRDLVRNGSPTEKAWVIGRILERAKWADIWRYLTVADIRDSLPHIRFRRRQDRDLWEYALDRWTRHGWQSAAAGTRRPPRFCGLSGRPPARPVTATRE